jgi:hypothetical protein
MQPVIKASTSAQTGSIKKLHFAPGLKEEPKFGDPYAQELPLSFTMNMNTCKQRVLTGNRHLLRHHVAEGHKAGADWGERNKKG